MIQVLAVFAQSCHWFVLCSSRACVGLKPQNHMMLEHKQSNMNCPTVINGNGMSVEHDLKRKYQEMTNGTTHGVCAHLATNGFNDLDH